MARTYVKLPEWNQTRMGINGWANVEPFLSYADQVMLSIRDTLRQALDPLGDHTHWIVSDVARWLGEFSTRGFAFIVRHMDGEVVPAPTGHEWLFILPGNGYYSTPKLRELFQGGAAGCAQYLIEVTGGVGFTSDGNPAIHYNPTAIATPYGGGWDANGELSGGDLSAPTNSPWTNLADFMPGTSHPRGLGFLGFNSPLNFWSTVWDDEKPFMALYYTRGRESYIGAANIFGNVVIPYLASDTFTTGNLYFSLSNNSSTAGSISSATVTMYNDAGTRVAVSSAPIYFHDKYTPSNSRTADGDYVWDLPIIIGSAGMKGYVDPDVMKVIGEYNGDYLKIFETNGVYYLKIQQAMAFPYTGNTPIFPPG